MQKHKKPGAKTVKFSLFLHHCCAKTGAKTVKFHCFCTQKGFCTQNRMFLHSNTLVFVIFVNAGELGSADARGGRLWWTPPTPYGAFYAPLKCQCSACSSCTKSHDRADQKLFWRGPKIFGRARSLVRFPPPPYHGPSVRFQQGESPNFRWIPSREAN